MADDEVNEGDVLVVDVDSHGRGYERLRQPSYRGLRTDLRAADL